MQGRKGKAWAVVVGSVCWMLVWSQAGAASGKTRTATGDLVSGGQGVWQLQVAGQAQPLRFRVTEQTKIWKEASAGAGALTPGKVVCLHGRGQNDRFTATRIQCLAPEESEWRDAKKKRSGAAYPAKARTTTLTARIEGLEPLTVRNRYGQVIRVESTPETRWVLRSQETEGGMSAGGKAQVTYTQQEGEPQAREIVLKQEG
jgi:hypothetical protein